MGEEYRSIILCSPDELDQAEAAKTSANELWNGKVMTEVKVLDKFYPAEDNHQNFYNENPDVGYCQVIINPKVAKFEKKFAEYMK